jgi:glycosyltransferase involved in cell wall biosynthesis
MRQNEKPSDRPLRGPLPAVPYQSPLPSPSEKNAPRRESTKSLEVPSPLPQDQYSEEETLGASSAEGSFYEDEFAKSKMKSSIGHLRDLRKTLAVIVPAMNEEKSIGGVLNEISRLDPDVIVVVVNGSTDRTLEIVRQYHARIVEYISPLGNDTGRAVGALAVHADIYLFTDGDIILPAEDLLPLIRAIENGADLAVNGLQWLVRYPKPDELCFARYFLNVVMGRSDLGVDGPLTIPHAFSHRGLSKIGKEILVNPLLVTAVALDERLNISIPISVNVLAMNRARKNHIVEPGQTMSKAFQRMYGDTVEAFNYLLQKRGKRGGYGQGNRNRKCFHQFISSAQAFAETRKHAPLTVVLSITRHSKNLIPLISQLQSQNTEIIAIVHDGNDEIRSTLAGLHIQYVEFPEYIGHDVAFAVGASLSSGQIIMFHDANVPIDVAEVNEFLVPLKANEADIALNNQREYFRRLQDMTAVHTGNYFMNTVIGMNHLSVSSMMIPPYAMHSRILQELNPASLMSPYRAQVAAVNMGFRVKTSFAIDALSRMSDATKETFLDNDRVLGDFMEALYDWIQRYGCRGGFTDEGRQRHAIAPFAPDSSS